MTTDIVVTKLDSASRALAQANTPATLKAVIDAAAAATVYAQRQKLGAEVIAHANSIRLDAERKLGSILAATPKNEGGRPAITGADAVPVSDTPTLAELGIDKKTSARAQRLSALDEETFESVRSGKTAMSAAFKAAKHRKVAETIDVFEGCTVADLSTLAEGARKFGTIYADPPWLYGNQATRASTGDHYTGMTVDEICALPVAGLAAENAHLHLWTTNAFLFDAQRVMESWGFEYRSCFVWVKPQMGMGNYWRVSHEFMLLGIRGSAPFRDRSLMSWGEFKRGAHSAKPEEIRSFIQRASEGPYLELFGRRAIDGWTVWGNQIERNLFHQPLEAAA